MKIIMVPTPVFETGDKVLTPKGLATVVHDELEGLPQRFASLGHKIQIAKHAKKRDAVIIRLEEETSEHGIGDEIATSRDNLIYMTPEEANAKDDK
jgi:hypothetical protein